jgi:uncharacterized OB-fold protein
MKSTLATSGMDQFAELNPDAYTKIFWDAAKEHRLVIPECNQCGTFTMPPTGFCQECTSQDLKYTQVPGTGEIYTFTVARHAVIPMLQAVVPYVIAVITMDGAPGARLVGNMIDCDIEKLNIGDKVQVVFDDVNPEVTIPRFTLA